MDELNQPTSVEFIGNTAYVVTLGGEIWKIDDVARAPFGAPWYPMARAERNLVRIVGLSI